MSTCIGVINLFDIPLVGEDHRKRQLEIQQKYATQSQEQHCCHRQE